MALSETRIQELAAEFARTLPPRLSLTPAPRPNGDCVRPRVKCAVSPGDGCVTDAQAFDLQQRVKAVVAICKAPYQTVWSSLNVRLAVPSYRLIPAEKYDEAVTFLEHWRSTGLPPT